jgi:tetratricopeptide (TPR) repeat protein
MLSKESGVITPFIILACLWYKNENFNLKKWWHRLPACVYKLSVFFFIIPFYLWLRHLAVGPIVPEETGMLALLKSFLKLPTIIVDYIYRTIFPLKLHSHHMEPDAKLLLNLIFLMFFILAFFSAVLKKNRPVILGIIIYVLFLAPKIPLLITGTFMLDHWVYPSNFGLFLIIIYLMQPYLEKKTVVTANVVYAILVISILNFNIKSRNSDIKIYEHAIKHKTSDQVYYNLAREYYFIGDYAKALKNLEFVCKKYPENEMFLNGYALVLAKTGNMQKAEKILNGLLEGASQFSGTFDNMAYVLEFKNNKKQSMEILKKGIERFPEDEKLKTHLVRLFLSSAHKEEAEKLLEEVLKLNPYNVESLINLGVFAAEKNDLKAAEKFWKKAQTIDPKNPALNKNLALLKEKLQNH